MTKISAERIAAIEARREELQQAMSAGDLDPQAFVKLSKDYAEIEPVAAAAREVRRLRDEAASLAEMTNEADDELRQMAADELVENAAALEAAERDLAVKLLPRDAADERAAMLEIRAGTGGDEAALFAGDLLRMYTRYAERQRWQVEVMSASESELGGYREVICRIAGFGAYSRLKFESGGHRVQRVPETETQGRIHTSACTVAIMPEADEVEDVNLNPADLRIDTFRASGAGGQHINKTDSAVRITHLPTGIVAECQDGRSQHANKASAMKVLAARIKDVQVRAQQSHIASTRKSLIGSGDRSERIRTYNFPQGRVTDHRINLTLYKIAAIMDGDMDELLDALAAEHQAELLAELAEQN